MAKYTWSRTGVRASGACLRTGIDETVDEVLMPGLHSIVASAQALSVDGVPRCAALQQQLRKGQTTIAPQL